MGIATAGTEAKHGPPQALVAKGSCFRQDTACYSDSWPMLPTDFTETSQAESGQSFKPVQGAQGMAFSRRSLAKSVKHTQYLVGGLEPSFFPYIGNKNPI